MHEYKESGREFETVLQVDLRSAKCPIMDELTIIGSYHY